MNYKDIASDESIEKVKTSLEANGFSVMVAGNAEEAKHRALAVIPDGSEVLTMTSVTLDAIGLSEAVQESGQYQSARNQLNSMDKVTQGREMRRLGAAPDYTVGSAHAVTEDGKVFIASNTGRQMPAYAYGAGKVVLVVGAQKIVADKEEAMKRIYDYVLPLESERAHKAYGVTGSYVSKLLMLEKEVQPGRITIIMVKQALGF